MQWSGGGVLNNDCNRKNVSVRGEATGGEYQGHLRDEGTRLEGGCGVGGWVAALGVKP